MQKRFKVKDHIFKAGITLVLKKARLQAWSQHIDDIIGEVFASLRKQIYPVYKTGSLFGSFNSTVAFFESFLPYYRKRREHAWKLNHLIINNLNWVIYKIIRFFEGF